MRIENNERQRAEGRAGTLGPSHSSSAPERSQIRLATTPENGQAYLDAVNSFPHVGHCHPRVVVLKEEKLQLNALEFDRLIDSLDQVLAEDARTFRLLFFRGKEDSPRAHLA